MTTKAHKLLTGADLHEPKGVASATSGQVYRADGAGSGSWQTLSLPTGTFKITIADFTSGGTWTKPASLFGVVFHILGGGGGSGDATAPTGGSTTLGSLAGVNGGTGNVTGYGTGGTLGTVPSGAKGFTGITASNNEYGFIAVMSGLLTSALTSSRFYKNVAPGPFGALYGYGAAGWGTASVTVGGSGAYMYGWIPTANLGATETITIGAGGIGTGSGAGTGGAGYCLVEQYITV